MNLYDPNGRFWKELWDAVTGFFGGTDPTNNKTVNGMPGEDGAFVPDAGKGDDSEGGSSWGGGGLPRSDEGDPYTSVTSTITVPTACAVLPEGHATGLSGSLGFFGAPSGTVEILTNYNTGEISGFTSGGMSAGIAGGASVSVTNTLVYGLGDDNSNYSGGFTGATISAPAASNISVAVTGAASSDGFGGIKQASVQGNVEPLRPDLGGTVAVGTVAGISIFPPINATASATTYSQPIPLDQLGPASILSQPFDYLMFLLRQGCNP